MKKLLCIISVLFFLITASACSVKLNKEPETGEKIANSQIDITNNLKVTIIDVGQGDSILIKTPKNNYILIDAGPKNESTKFFNFIENHNINEINTLIATHPHEDHIGNMSELISKYPVQNIYMPKVVTNTPVFKKLMETIKKRNLSIKEAKAGVKFNIDSVKFEFIAPGSKKYANLNNYSAVLKITYDNVSFLLMGDAEKLSEKEILKSGIDIKADVIKIGHHGSSSSSSINFIKTVSPQYAVISCGLNNDFGHPHKETLRLLNSYNIKLYRTDKNGTVEFSTDGNKITVNCER